MNKRATSRHASRAASRPTLLYRDAAYDSRQQDREEAIDLALEFIFFCCVALVVGYFAGFLLACLAVG